MSMALRLFPNSPLGAKLAVIGLIIAGLMIPMSMLRSLIQERAGMRDQAVNTVANGWGGNLTAGGPLLRVPFDLSRTGANGEIITETHQFYALAELLNVQAVLEQREARRVGIYEVPVYAVRLKLTGNFQLRDVMAAASGGTVHWSEARIRLPLSDVRSVRELTAASAAGRNLSFGPAPSGGLSGIEARLDLSALARDSTVPFAIDVLLAGSQSVALLPTAATTRLSMRADWPDPQFQGAFLPLRYSVDARGFDAQWQVLALNRAFSQSWIDEQVDTGKVYASAFGVALYQSVDVYQRSERAVKYALLFIALTFLSFFGWELIGQVRVHPVQYLFIGLALSTFYLLLIALAEHLTFWLSYWLGAAALVLLLGLYIAGAMASARRGAMLSAIMTAVYALLYLLVLSENYALLTGAVALFGVMAAVMLATRKLRWEAVP
jgi:inner membrane protein